MPRFSTTLNADQFEWVKDEAQRRGRSQADIVRLCIDAVRTGSVNIGEHLTQPVNTEPIADLRERVAELEKRVDGLEGGNSSRDLETDSPEIEGRETPSSRSNPHTQTVAKAVAYAREHQPVSRAEILDAVGDEVDIRGDSLWKRHIRDALKEAGFEYDRAGGVATWAQPDG